MDGSLEASLFKEIFQRRIVHTSHRRLENIAQDFEGVGGEEIIMVYGVFGGEYSDWSVEGYFNNREDAEKYCAARPRAGFYVKGIPKINADVKNVRVKYYHEVVFDFFSGMRNEPTRYEYYCGKDKLRKIVHNAFPNGGGWISISTMAETREGAEKIAQDIWTKFLSYYSETQDYSKAAGLIGSTKLYSTPHKP